MDTFDARLRRREYEQKGRPPCRHMPLEIEDDADTKQPTENRVCVTCGKSAPRDEFYQT